MSPRPLVFSATEIRARVSAIDAELRERRARLHLEQTAIRQLLIEKDEIGGRLALIEAGGTRRVTARGTLR